MCACPTLHAPWLAEEITKAMCRLKESQSLWKASSQQMPESRKIGWEVCAWWSSIRET
jgi:uncharacterized protein YacL (UPF0231 family)